VVFGLDRLKQGYAGCKNSPQIATVPVVECGDCRNGQYPDASMSPALPGPARLLSVVLIKVFTLSSNHTLQMFPPSIHEADDTVPLIKLIANIRTDLCFCVCNELCRAG